MANRVGNSRQMQNLRQMQNSRPVRTGGNQPRGGGSSTGRESGKRYSSKSSEQLLYEDLLLKSGKWRAVSYSFAGLVFFVVLIIFLYYVLETQRIQGMVFPVFQYLSGILLILAALINLMDQNRILMMCIAGIFYFTGFLINMIYNLLQPELSVAFFLLSLFLLSPGVILLFRMAVQDEYLQISKKVKPKPVEMRGERPREREEIYADYEEEEDEEYEEEEVASSKKKEKKKKKKEKKKKEKKKKFGRKKSSEDGMEQPVRPVHRIYDDLTEDLEDEEETQNPREPMKEQRDPEEERDSSEEKIPINDRRMDTEEPEEDVEEENEKEENEEKGNEEEASEGFWGRVIKKGKAKEKRKEASSLEKEIAEYVEDKLSEVKLCKVTMENTLDRREFERNLKRLKEIYQDLSQYERTTEVIERKLFAEGLPTDLYTELETNERKMRAEFDAKINRIDVKFVNSKLKKDSDSNE